jgi:hypothetical protein
MTKEHTLLKDIGSPLKLNLSVASEVIESIGKEKTAAVWLNSKDAIAEAGPEILENIIEQTRPFGINIQGSLMAKLLNVDFKEPWGNIWDGFILAGPKDNGRNKRYDDAPAPRNTKGSPVLVDAAMLHQFKEFNFFKQKMNEAYLSQSKLNQVLLKDKVFELRGPDNGLFIVKLESREEVENEMKGYRATEFFGVNAPLARRIPERLLSSLPSFMTPMPEAGLLVQTLNSIEYDDLRQKKSSGLEELILMSHILGHGDLDYDTKNTFKKVIGDQERYIAYDFGTYQTDEVGIDRWMMEMGQLDFLHLLDVVKNTRYDQKRFEQFLNEHSDFEDEKLQARENLENFEYEVFRKLKTMESGLEEGSRKDKIEVMLHQLEAVIDKAMIRQFSKIAGALDGLTYKGLTLDLKVQNSRMAHYEIFFEGREVGSVTLEKNWLGRTIKITWFMIVEEQLTGQGFFHKVLEEIYKRMPDNWNLSLIGLTNDRIPKNWLDRIIDQRQNSPSQFYKTYPGNKIDNITDDRLENNILMAYQQWVLQHPSEGLEPLVDIVGKVGFGRALLDTGFKNLRIYQNFNREIVINAKKSSKKILSKTFTKIIGEFDGLKHAGATYKLVYFNPWGTDAKFSVESLDMKPGSLLLGWDRTRKLILIRDIRMPITGEGQLRAVLSRLHEIIPSDWKMGYENVSNEPTIDNWYKRIMAQESNGSEFFNTLDKNNAPEDIVKKYLIWVKDHPSDGLMTFAELASEKGFGRALLDAGFRDLEAEIVKKRVNLYARKNSQRVAPKVDPAMLGTFRKTVKALDNFKSGNITYKIKPFSGVSVKYNIDIDGELGGDLFLEGNLSERTIKITSLTIRKLDERGKGHARALFIKLNEIMPPGWVLEFDNVVNSPTLEGWIIGIAKEKNKGSDFFKAYPGNKLVDLSERIKAWNKKGNEEYYTERFSRAQDLMFYLIEVYDRWSTHHQRDGLTPLSEIASEQGIGRAMLDANFTGLTVSTHQNIVLSAQKTDAAMKVNKKDVGGIDLTSDKVLEVKEEGAGIKFKMDPAMLEEFRNAPGLVPVIINIEPIKDLPRFLGVQNQDQQLVSV